MLTKIVAELKKGTIKNVVPYGSSLPTPPYVVVKPEHIAEGRRFRIIAHVMPDYQCFLEDYMREVIVTLEEFQATSRTGALNALGRVEQIVDIITNNDDGTIAMEAAFVMPTHTF